MAEPMPFEKPAPEVHRPELVEEPIAREAETWTEQERWRARGEEFGRTLGQRLIEARRRIRGAIRRAQELGNQYPLQTIGAIAGAAFLLGIALRVGRARRG